jgi:hypothetical protein
MTISDINKFVIDFLISHDSTHLIEAWSQYAPRLKKIKKVRKEGPKRGKTSYLFFCSDKRGEIMKEFPGLSVKEITIKLGALWKELKNSNNEEYKHYEKLASEDNKRYYSEKNEFKKTTMSPSVVHEKDEEENPFEKFCRLNRKAVKDKYPDLSEDELLKKFEKLYNKHRK